MPINQYGFEVDENGDLVRTPTGDRQRTPGAQAINLHTGQESRDTGMGRGVKNLDWSTSTTEAGGRKQYRRPSESIEESNKYNDSGGLFHSRGNLWNSDTGQYEEGGLDWGKILSFVVAGTLTAGAASALMGGGAAAESALASTVATGQVPAELAGTTAAVAAPTTGGLTAGGVVKAGLTGYSTLKKLQGLTSGGNPPQSTQQGAPQDGSTLDQFGRVMGAGAQAEGAARRYDASLQGGLDNNNNNAQVQAARFNLGAPDQLLNRLARLGVGINAKDMAPTGDARIDKFGGGGLRPSLLQNPETQQGFKQAQRDALLSLMNKDYQVKPTMSKLPDAGAMEKAGGAISTATGLASATKGLWQPDTATKIPDWDPSQWSGPIDNAGWEDLA